MSDIPEHIWEAARSLRNAVCWQSNASVEPIASALLAAEQRGREEALSRVEATGREIVRRALNGTEKALGDGIIHLAASVRKEAAIRSRSEGKGGE